MQQTTKNSAASFIKEQGCSFNVPDLRRLAAGDACLGPPVGVGGGVHAVESIPTHSLFSLCTPTESVESSVDTRDLKRHGRQRVANPGDMDIVGDLAHVPGESSLQASAFSKETREQARAQTGLEYNPSDFRPYSQRLLR